MQTGKIGQFNSLQQSSQWQSKKERTIVMSRAQLQLKHKSKNDWPCSVQTWKQLIFLTAAVTITLMLQSEQVLWPLFCLRVPCPRITLYTGQLFLSQMHEIFTLSWPRFLETSRRLPRISDEFPKTFERCQKLDVRRGSEDVWALPKLFRRRHWF